MSHRIFKTSTGHDLELRRPTYKAFRNIATKVNVLMEVPFEATIASPEFAQVLNACVVQQLGHPDQDGDDGILANLPYDEAARLWDAVLEHCEFASFFAERRTQHFEASKRQAELEASLQAAQIAAMKKSGLLPENYSLQNALGDLTPATNPILTPSFSTTTPAATDGDGNASKTSTSGGPSGTSPKPSAAAKRTRD